MCSSKVKENESEHQEISNTNEHDFEKRKPYCNKQKQNLTIGSHRYLPNPDTVHPPKVLFHLDFSFYDTVSLRGFTLVLGVAHASIPHPWEFLIH